MVIHIQNKILTHNRQTNKANIGPKIEFYIIDNQRNNTHVALFFADIVKCVICSHKQSKIY